MYHNKSVDKKQGESKVGIKRKSNQIADAGREFGGGGLPSTLSTCTLLLPVTHIPALYTIS